VPNTVTTSEASNDRSSSQSLNPIYDELLDACLIDDLDSVRNILDKNPELIKHTYPSKYGGGNSLLHAAAVGPSPNVVEELLERGIDVNLKNDLGYRPLEHAIYDTSTYYGRSYLETANLSSRVNKVLELLLENGAEISKPQNPEKSTALHLSIDCLLIAYKQNSINKTNLDTVSMLLNYGADPNAVDRFGQTPLHILPYRYEKAALQILDLLIYKGADINIKNNSDKTPAMLAVESENGYVLWNLIKYGHPHIPISFNNYYNLSKTIEREISFVGKNHRTYDSLNIPLLHLIGSESVTQPLMKEFLYLCKTQAVSTKSVRTFLDITFTKDAGYEIGHHSKDIFINTHKRILKNIAAEYNKAIDKAIDSRNEAIIDFVNDIKRAWESDKDRKVKVINLNIKEDYEYAINYAEKQYGLELYEQLGTEVELQHHKMESASEISTYIGDIETQKSDFD
jgi:ankyrin repeat protein